MPIFPRLFLCGFAAALLLACDRSTDADQSRQPTAAELAEIRQSPAIDLTPNEVAETFALGGDFTDLQRDVLTKKLVGSVVEWDIQVYKIEFNDGGYDVMSQPFAVKSADAINLLRASVRIYPQSDRDHEVLRGAKTNDAIRVRGKVQGITLRTVIFIDPCILLPEAGKP